MTWIQLLKIIELSNRIIATERALRLASLSTNNTPTQGENK